MPIQLHAGIIATCAMLLVAAGAVSMPAAAQPPNDATDWTRIGIDTDNDGEIDAYEHVRTDALERARRASRDRPGRQRTAAPREGRDMERNPELRRIRGVVTNIRSQRLAGVDEEHLYVRVKTERGTAKVDLGPISNLSRLDISEGERLVVIGYPGTVNGRQMLMAQQLRQDSAIVPVKRQHTDRVRRVRGEVQALRKARFKGHDHRHLIGRVELVSGRTAMIDFGPAEELARITPIEPGDEVRVLVASGRINDQPALVAKEIRKGNNLISVDRPRSGDTTLNNRQRAADGRQR